jgi:hypothetical protein
MMLIVFNLRLVIARPSSFCPQDDIETLQIRAFGKPNLNSVDEERDGSRAAATASGSIWESTCDATREAHPAEN